MPEGGHRVVGGVAAGDPLLWLAQEGLHQLFHLGQDLFRETFLRREPPARQELVCPNVHCPECPRIELEELLARLLWLVIPLVCLCLAIVCLCSFVIGYGTGACRSSADGQRRRGGGILVRC